MRQRQDRTGRAGRGQVREIADELVQAAGVRGLFTLGQFAESEDGDHRQAKQGVRVAAVAFGRSAGQRPCNRIGDPEQLLRRGQTLALKRMR